MNTYKPGDIIAGKYRICCEMGGGAMGTVYRAEHELMHRPVAIKILHGEAARNEEIVKRFRREAQAAASLEHPNICTVIDFDVLESGDFYLVMELLEGEPLSTRLERAGRLQPIDAVRIMRQLLSALQCIGDQGIVHRDIKPDNIFLVSRNGIDDIVKLFDFGIAHDEHCDGDMRTLTQAGQIYGTPQYISPEQVVGNKVDHRTDLYASGVVFYEMLMGEPPFTGKNYVELLHKHLSAVPPHVAPDLPQSAAFDAIIQKLLSKKPEDRYACANDVNAALDDITLALSQDPVEIATVRASGSAAIPLALLGKPAPTPLPLQRDTLSPAPDTSAAPSDDEPLSLADGLSAVRDDIIAVIPKTKRQRRAFFLLILGTAFLLIVAIVLLLVFLTSAQNAASTSPDGTPRPSPIARLIPSRPQPFNYQEQYKIAHDTELSKDQNILSAAENLFAGNAQDAVASLQSVKQKYLSHPNFLRLYLVALYDVPKKSRDYDEILDIMGQLMAAVPDAPRNPYVRDIIFDFVNSSDHHEKTLDTLQKHASATGMAWLVILSPYDRYELRLKRLISVFDALPHDDVPDWLNIGVDIWRPGKAECELRLDIFQKVEQNGISDEFYEHIILPMSRVKSKECKTARRIKRMNLGSVDADCNDCLREWFKTQIDARNSE